jgi:hypothetical protein
VKPGAPRPEGRKPGRRPPSPKTWRPLDRRWKPLSSATMCGRRWPMSGATELAPAEAGGAPGIDDMSVEDLALHLKDHWLEIKAQLLAGTYRPQPVRRVEIPKPAEGRSRPRYPKPAPAKAGGARSPHPAGGAAGAAGRTGTRRSPRRASACVPVAARIRRWRGHRSASQRDTAG